jgi:hypothetical protein
VEAGAFDGSAGAAAGHRRKVTTERGKHPLFNKLLDYFGGSIGLWFDCYAGFSRL